MQNFLSKSFLGVLFYLFLIAGSFAQQSIPIKATIALPATIFETQNNETVVSGKTFFESGGLEVQRIVGNLVTPDGSVLQSKELKIDEENIGTFSFDILDNIPREFLVETHFYAGGEIIASVKKEFERKGTTVERVNNFSIETSFEDDTKKAKLNMTFDSLFDGNVEALVIGMESGINKREVFREKTKALSVKKGSPFSIIWENDFALLPPNDYVLKVQLFYNEKPVSEILTTEITTKEGGIKIDRILIKPTRNLIKNTKMSVSVSGRNLLNKTAKGVLIIKNDSNNILITEEFEIKNEESTLWENTIEFVLPENSKFLTSEVKVLDGFDVLTSSVYETRSYETGFFVDVLGEKTIKIIDAHGNFKWVLGIGALVFFLLIFYLLIRVLAKKKVTLD